MGLFDFLFGNDAKIEEPGDRPDPVNWWSSDSSSNTRSGGDASSERFFG